MADDDKNSGGKRLVVTPGGPRPRDRVHEVRGNEVVSFDERGAAGVRSLDPRRAADAASLRSRGLVLTPGGFRPPGRIHRVGDGERLNVSSDRILLQDAEGKTVRDMIQAPDPERSVIPALGSGWIAARWWNNNTGNTLTRFRAKWLVPPEPRSRGSQTIFLFNGMDPATRSDAILQPVLQWGPSAAGGGSHWSVASWYVTSAGDAFHTDLVQVSVGQLLEGLMTMTGSNGSVFDYTAEFGGIANTTLTIQGVAELPWCNHTLEAYSMERCSEYPQTERTLFAAISIETAVGAVTPTWSRDDSVTDCGQHSETEGRNVPIYYRSDHEFASLNQAAWVTGTNTYRYGHHSIPNIAITGAPGDSDARRWATLHDGTTYRLYCGKGSTADRIYQFGFDGSSYVYGHNSIPELTLVGFPADTDASSFAMLHDGNAFRLYLRRNGDPRMLYQASWVAGTTTYKYGHNSIPNIPVTGFPGDTDWARWGMLHDGTAYRFYAFKAGTADRVYQGSFNPNSQAYEWGLNSIPELIIQGMPATSDTRSFAMSHDNVDYRFYFQTW
jgi:hypothetical protein